MSQDSIKRAINHFLQDILSYSKTNGRTFNKRLDRIISDPHYDSNLWIDQYKRHYEEFYVQNPDQIALCFKKLSLENLYKLPEELWIYKCRSMDNNNCNYVLKLLENTSYYEFFKRICIRSRF